MSDCVVGEKLTDENDNFVELEANEISKELKEKLCVNPQYDSQQEDLNLGVESVESSGDAKKTVLEIESASKTEQPEFTEDKPQVKPEDQSVDASETDHIENHKDAVSTFVDTLIHEVVQAAKTSTELESFAPIVDGASEISDEPIQGETNGRGTNRRGNRGRGRGGRGFGHYRGGGRGGFSPNYSKPAIFAGPLMQAGRGRGGGYYEVPHRGRYSGRSPYNNRRAQPGHYPSPQRPHIQPLIPTSDRYDEVLGSIEYNGHVISVKVILSSSAASKLMENSAYSLRISLPLSTPLAVVKRIFCAKFYLTRLMSMAKYSSHRNSRFVQEERDMFLELGGGNGNEPRRMPLVDSGLSLGRHFVLRSPQQNVYISECETLWELLGAYPDLERPTPHGSEITFFLR